jgi:hypothetical protein
MFGIRPTGLNAFTLTPRLPDGWNRMSLRAVHAFGRVFDIDVSRTGSGMRVRVTPDKGAPFDRIAVDGVTQRVVF